MSKSQTQPTLSLPSRAIGAVAKWASTDPNRTHLHMVLFGVSEYVATDGHRMVIAPYRDDENQPRKYAGRPFGVDALHLLGALSARRAITGNESGDLALTPDGDGRVSIVILPGVKMSVPDRNPADYPPYERVIPSESPNSDTPVGRIFNPRFMAALAEVNDATVVGRETPGIKITAWDSSLLGPVMFENAAGVRFILMPMRAP